MLGREGLFEKAQANLLQLGPDAGVEELVADLHGKAADYGGIDIEGAFECSVADMAADEVRQAFAHGFAQGSGAFDDHLVDMVLLSVKVHESLRDCPDEVHAPVALQELEKVRKQTGGLIAGTGGGENEFHLVGIGHEGIGHGLLQFRSGGERCRQGLHQLVQRGVLASLLSFLEQRLCVSAGDKSLVHGLLFVFYLVQE